MDTSRNDAMQLNHRRLDAEQTQRLRRARRTAVVMGIIALAVFAFSIAQMLWLLHHPKAHAKAVEDALTPTVQATENRSDLGRGAKRSYAT